MTTQSVAPSKGPATSETPPPAALRFWRMVGAGAGLALLTSLVNVLISGGLFFRALNAQIAEKGYGGSTDAALFFTLAQVFVYPILQLILLGLALPLMFWINPDRLRHPVLAAIAVLTPTLVTSWLWMNGGVLFWMMTVPGVACALAGSVAFVVLIRRGLFQVRLRDIGAREEKA